MKRSMTSAQQIRISVHGVDFVCLTQGSGPLVLLVHGFPDIPQSWSAQIDALSHQGYRVVAPYLPGYLPSRIERGADDLRADLMREQANCFVAEYHYIEVLEAGHFLHRE
jgi:alpha-beta hydrolase superfamily lysophospholipase